MGSSSSETSQSFKSSRNEGYWSPDLDSIDNAVEEMCELEVKTEEDKEIAAKAVALVVNKTRKGIVPLCTSVACLLQDKYRLERQVQQLQKELSSLKMHSKSLKLVGDEEEDDLFSSSCSKQTLSADEDVGNLNKLQPLPHKNSFVTVAIVHQEPDKKNSSDNLDKISSSTSCNEGERKLNASDHSQVTCEKGVQCNIWDETNRRLHKHLKLNSQIINKLVQGLTAKQQDRNSVRQSFYPVTDSDCNRSLNRNLNPNACFYINRYSFEKNPLEEDLCSMERCCKDLILPSGKKNSSSENHKKADVPRNNYSRYLSPFQKNNLLDLNDENSAIVKSLDGSAEVSHCNPFTAPFPLIDCKCRICEMLIQISKKKNNAVEAYQLSFRNKSILNYGDVVLITGEKVGSVHYLGHLNGYEDAVFVGVSLDTKESDQENHSEWIKFECSHGIGVFVPLHDIICIVERPCW